MKEEDEARVDYKERIINLLPKVNNQSILKRVYKLLVYLYIKEESG